MEVLDIWKEVLVRSGQFLIEPTNIELDQDRFVTLVRDSIRFLDKYCPIESKFNLEITGTSGGGGVYTFTESFAVNGVTLGIPYMMGSVIPLSLFGTVPLSLRHLFPGDPALSGASQLEKCEIPVEYRKPSLYVPIQGTWDVSAAFKHREESYTTNDGCPAYRYPTLESCDPSLHNFFQMVTAKFMIGLGRSRRAFTVQELPIQVDADALLNEGLQRERELEQEFTEIDHDFTLAWL